jgi:hypothetical protein
MQSRLPARDGLGRFETVVAAVLAALAVPVPGAAVDSAENRLDVSLKLLYRARKTAIRAHDSLRGDIETPSRDRALREIDLPWKSTGIPNGRRDYFGATAALQVAWTRAQPSWQS